jgi:hypothetical protein
MTGGCGRMRKHTELPKGAQLRVVQICYFVVTSGLRKRSGELRVPVVDRQGRK